MYSRFHLFYADVICISVVIGYYRWRSCRLCQSLQKLSPCNLSRPRRRRSLVFQGKEVESHILRWSLILHLLVQIGESLLPESDRLQHYIQPSAIQSSWNTNWTGNASAWSSPMLEERHATTTFLESFPPRLSYGSCWFYRKSKNNCQKLHV